MENPSNDKIKYLKYRAGIGDSSLPKAPDMALILAEKSKAENVAKCKKFSRVSPCATRLGLRP